MSNNQTLQTIPPKMLQARRLLRDINLKFQIYPATSIYLNQEWEKMLKRHPDDDGTQALLWYYVVIEQLTPMEM